MRDASHLLSPSRKILSLSWAIQEDVILNSVESNSNHYQYRLRYRSHSHKYHHGLAGSSGLAVMARTLLPAADCPSRSFLQANFNGEGRYSHQIQTSSLAQDPLFRCARVMKSPEMDNSKAILPVDHQRQKCRPPATSSLII